MKNNQETVHTPKELFAELQTLVSEAQTMMADSVTGPTADAMDALRVRFAAAQERFGEYYEGAKQRVVAGAKCTDEAIRANPYQSVAIAAGVGLLLGVLLGRRGGR